MLRKRLFRDGLYILEDDRVRQFLMLGSDSALLIDTGFADSHVADVVREITDAPVTVIMTHRDRDHTGGLHDFGSCYLHQNDWHLVQQDGVRLLPLREGDVFCCGAYRLETVEIPGHTYGSVAFFDREQRLLFPGDSVQKGGPIYMFGSHRNLPRYIESLRKLSGWADKVDTLLPCHHACPIDPSYMEKDLEDALALQAGRLPGEKHPVMPCSTYQGRWTSFYA